MRGVRLTSNTEGILIDAGSTGNDVRGNVATGTKSGIDVSQGSIGNTIIGNSAQQNSFFDLEDDNTGCDNNLWRGNDFGTASQSCIH